MYKYSVSTPAPPTPNFHKKATKSRHKYTWESWCIRLQVNESRRALSSQISHKISNFYFLQHQDSQSAFRR